MKFKRITIDPAQMDGVPCIRHMRIPVATVLNMIAKDISKKDILKYYPDLESGDIDEALLFSV
ncbi:MAG TPA: DUF433 domain-containing protein [Bacteroidetes bacterium]|nr:DUF433 domain-containing protein [Bacteroidota bacterium]